MFVRSLLAASLCLASIPAFAHDYSVGDLHITHPWSRATPKGAPVAGGYLAITNKGSKPDRLVGGSAEVAGRFEIHEMATVDGVMRMRELPKGLEIKPGETVKLEPGSYHIMLMGLKQPLKEGQRVSGTLVFEHAGKVEIEYAVQGMGSRKPGHGHGADHGGGQDHGQMKDHGKMKHGH